MRLVTRDHLDVKLAELDTKLAELKVDLIKWMAGLVAGSTLAIIIALLRIAK
jgi:hypothetical protein